MREKLKHLRIIAFEKSIKYYNSLNALDLNNMFNEEYEKLLDEHFERMKAIIYCDNCHKYQEAFLMCSNEETLTSCFDLTWIKFRFKCELCGHIKEINLKIQNDEFLKEAIKVY